MQEEQLAAVRPMLMLEVAAKGLPQNLVLPIDTCRALRDALTTTLDGLDKLPDVKPTRNQRKSAAKKS
jgi:hypothetical protein